MDTEDDRRPKFSDWLAQHRAGHLDDDLTATLAELAERVLFEGKPGSITLKLSRTHRTEPALDRVMTWSKVEDAPGVFTLRRGGVDVGTLSFLPSMPDTGESLFPTVLAGVVVAALNDYSATVVVETEMRYRAKGWASAAAFHDELEATKSVTADLPPETRAAIQTAWVRRGWSNPVTPEQMAQWQDEILELACTTVEEPAA